MAGADHLQLQGTHPAQGIPHEGLEGADDAVKIVFGGPQVPLPVGDLAGQDVRASVVGTEGVAGHQHLILPDIGVHGVGPVQVGHYQKFQSLVVQSQSLAVPDGDGVKVPVDDLFQEIDGTAGGHDLDAGVQFQQLFHAAAVVRLGVADYQIIHLLNGGNGLHLFQPAVQTLDLGGLEQYGVVCRFEHIGIVGGTELGVHDYVKDPQIRVQCAGKVKTGLELQKFHSHSPFAERMTGWAALEGFHARGPLFFEYTLRAADRQQEISLLFVSLNFHVFSCGSAVLLYRLYPRIYFFKRRFIHFFCKMKSWGITASSLFCHSFQSADRSVPYASLLLHFCNFKTKGAKIELVTPHLQNPYCPCLVQPPDEQAVRTDFISYFQDPSVGNSGRSAPPAP